MREPLNASVTLSEATAPVKLPTRHCPLPGLRVNVRDSVLEGWYPNVDSTKAKALASKSPTYPVHLKLNLNIKL